MSATPPAAGSPTTPGIATGIKPKKSVALSGVVAGNTALCTVGRTGNDLHYRGYNILDVADICEFEEIAYLLLYEKLPTHAELAVYKKRLRSLRALPTGVDGGPYVWSRPRHLRSRFKF